MSATTTAAANAELVNQKLADFMSNQKKGKKRGRHSASANQDIVANAAAGQDVPETQASMLSDHHFSKIDETKIVLGLDKRKNKSAKASAKATADDKMLSFIRNAQGAQTLLKVEIAPFVLGVTSLLSHEGTYGKAKEEKSHENARGDCYFLAIMWAGQLEGRPIDPALTEEQQACLKKIYKISRQIMRLMFDEAPWAKFRGKAVDWARADMKMDYIDASPKFKGNNRAAISETDYEAIEKANPDLMQKMLLHAREEYFLKNANQFPGRPSEQETAAGAKSAQMFSMRQKCYYIQEGKFDAALDKGKKFDPLPGVICNEKTWPEIYRVMTGTGPKDGRRVYNPIEYFNGVNGGAPMVRPMKTILVDDVDEEGRAVKRQVKIPDAIWNPMMEKPETKIANGKIVEQKIVKINSLVACVVKFEPYVGPEQWGVRVMMNGTMSHMDHVLWTPDVVVRQDKWARAYNYDDVIEVEVPKTAAEMAIEAKEKADKAKTNQAAQNAASGDVAGDDDSGSYESSEEEEKKTADAPKPDVVVRAAPKTHTPATFANAAPRDDDSDDPVLAAAKAKLFSAGAARASAILAQTVVQQQEAVATDDKKRKKDKQQAGVVEAVPNGHDDERQQKKAKKNKAAQEPPVEAPVLAPVVPQSPAKVSKLTKRSKRDEDSGDELPLTKETVVEATKTVAPVANSNGGDEKDSGEDDNDDEAGEESEEESSEKPPTPPPTKKVKKTRGGKVSAATAAAPIAIVSDD